MIGNKTTIVLDLGEEKVKLFKVIFNNDGSYFITAPYHNSISASVFKLKVNYKNGDQRIDLKKSISPKSLLDDKLRLKLSHHPDGFLQFSGQGIISGKTCDGKIKGIGIYSWKLDDPPRGPAFGISIKGIHKLSKYNKVKNALILTKTDIKLKSINDSLLIEGFYIPREFEQYIYIQNNKEIFEMTDPYDVFFKSFVVRPNKNNISNGFFAICVKPCNLNFGNIDHGYIFSSSTGDATLDCNNQIIEATGLYAIYPEIISLKNSPTLNWKI